MSAKSLTWDSYSASQQDDVKFSDLVGKTLTQCVGEVGSDEVRFVCDDGSEYVLAHMQDCCESVNVEDICGPLSDLVGSPITQAEESSNSDPIPGHEDEACESFTWTFYRLATAKGSVVIRWLGESNGYYSESVDFVRVKKPTA